MALQWLLVLIPVLAVQGLDPCTQYTLLDDPKRSTQYNGTQDLCDRILPQGWYRFKDADMPTTCVKQYHCGTHVPIWLNGQIPTVADGAVTQQACADFRPNDGDCCDFSLTVRVMNCGAFALYYLRGTPGCSMAYCAGTRDVCAGDKYSVSGFGPCIDAYPKLTLPPVLSRPMLLPTDYAFRCLIPYPTSKTDAKFEVTWLMNGQPVTSLVPVTVTGTTRSISVQGHQLEGYMNQDLSCSIKTMWTDNRSGGMASPVQTSNIYWMGVKSSQYQIPLTDTHTSSQVRLVATVPVVCQNQGQTDCSVDFKISTDNDKATTDACSVKLEPGHWNATTGHTTSAPFTVTAPPRIITEPSSLTYMHLNASNHGAGHQWNIVPMPTVHVYRNTTRPSAICSMVGDPHIKTFDMKSKRYDQLQTGQYTAANVHKHAFTIEIKNFHCGKHQVGCICAVAMREGNDVITIDMCHNHGYPKVAIKNPSTFSNLTNIVQSDDGKTYVTTFRSGAVVKVTSFKLGLNAWVTVPGQFYGETEGLCGNYDLDDQNDMTGRDGRVHAFTKRPNSFIDTWRIPHGHSIFERSMAVYVPTTAALPTGPVECPSTNTTAQNETVQVFCLDCKPITHKIAQLSVTAPPVLPTPASHVSSAPAISTSSPSEQVTTGPDAVLYISPENATRICNTTLTSYSSALKCIVHHMAIAMQDIMAMCVYDIQTTGNPEMAISSLATLMQECSHEILIDPSLTHNGVPPEAKVCPSACSGHGDCNAGVCACSPGFEASDCSVNSREPPTITGIPGGPCDVSISNCFQPDLVGNNMNHSTQTQCVVHRVEQFGGGLGTEKQAGMVTSAEFLSTQHVRCHIPLPSTGSVPSGFTSYTIRLSNNGGLTESVEQQYVIYNSRCVTCDADSNCYMKAGTCKIDNVCYNAGDRSDDGRCVPSVDPTRWVTDDVTYVAAVPTVPVYRGLNYYTAAHSGCGCFFDATRTDCACCRNIGCPCDRENPHTCYDCIHADTCRP